MALNKSQAETVNFGNSVKKKLYEKRAGLVDTFVTPESAKGRLQSSSKFQTAQAIDSLVKGTVAGLEGAANIATANAKLAQQNVENFVVTAIDQQREGVDWTEDKGFAQFTLQQKLYINRQLARNEAQAHNRRKTENLSSQGSTLFTDGGFEKYYNDGLKTFDPNDTDPLSSIYKAAYLSEIASLKSPLVTKVNDLKTAKDKDDLKIAFENDLGGATYATQQGFLDKESNDEVIPQEEYNIYAKVYWEQSETVFQNSDISFNLLNDKNKQQHKILSNSELKVIQRDHAIEMAKATGNFAILDPEHQPKGNDGKSLFSDATSIAAFATARRKYETDMKELRDSRLARINAGTTFNKGNAAIAALSGSAFATDERGYIIKDDNTGLDLEFTGLNDKDTYTDYLESKQKVKQRLLSFEENADGIPLADEKVRKFHRFVKINPFFLSELKTRLNYDDETVLTIKESNTNRLSVEQNIRFSILEGKEFYHEYDESGNAGEAIVDTEGKPYNLSNKSLTIMLNSQKMNTSDVKLISNNLDNLRVLEGYTKELNLLETSIDGEITKDSILSGFQKSGQFSSIFNKTFTDIEKDFRAELSEHMVNSEVAGNTGQPEYRNTIKDMVAKYRDEYISRIKKQMDFKPENAESIFDPNNKELLEEYLESINDPEEDREDLDLQLKLININPPTDDEIDNYRNRPPEPEVKTSSISLTDNEAQVKLDSLGKLRQIARQGKLKNLKDKYNIKDDANISIRSLDFARLVLLDERLGNAKPPFVSRGRTVGQFKSKSDPKYIEALEKHNKSIEDMNLRIQEIIKGL